MVGLAPILIFCGSAQISPLAFAGEFVTLKGHGGPVMDLAVSPVAGQVGSASFDNSVGLWEGRKPSWLDGHEAAVNTVTFIDETRVVSAGDDFDIIVWDQARDAAIRLEGHTAKVTDLAVSPNQKLLASASWDNRIGLWPLDGTFGIDKPQFLIGHTAGVNAVAFSADGSELYSASVDGTIRVWNISKAAQERVLADNGFGINVISLGGFNEQDKATWLAYGALDGITRFIDIDNGEVLRDFTLDRRPILAMAYDKSRHRLVTGDGQGYITIINTQTWQIERDFKAALRGPIWALAFSGDGENILAGGIENIVYSWPIASLKEFEPMAQTAPSFLRRPEEMTNGERQFQRKCSVCHALTATSGRKAGPSLYKIFGRKAGTLSNYHFSSILEKSGLVWNETTIDRLFELGPDHYIPGSKMPMQRIVAPEDRADLIDYLKQAAN